MAGDALARGRTCYEQRAWDDAYEALAEADAADPLAPDDLEALALSAGLTGRDEAFLGAYERLCALASDAGDNARAAWAALWMAVRLIDLGEFGRASGWLSRAQKFLEQVDGECIERGYLMLPAMFQQLGGGDNAAAEATAARIVEVGERFGNSDLIGLGHMGQGRAVVRQGRVAEGLALLDEAMLAATMGDLSPLITGLVYCNVIATCQQVYAVDRAREWTTALGRWCDEQPQLVTFTASCMVHRSEVMQLGGRWREAVDEAERACERVARHADRDAMANAFYQRAELHRLRGQWDQAEAAYREASDHGAEPQPGLALLRLAQGQGDAAASAVRRLLDTTEIPWQRARFLPAFAEILLATGDVDGADDAATELETIAGDFGVETLLAMAAHARGAVCLARGDATAAATRLREAFVVWQKLGAPYIAARIRVLMSRACRELGDTDGAELELAGARKVFEQLGAPMDPATAAAPAPAHGLTQREVEVLGHVAGGLTNKAIAAALGVSERTIDRHVSNIFTKLDVSSRAAATAYAYEHGLVGPARG